MNGLTGAAMSDFLPNSGNYRAEGFVIPDGTVGIFEPDTDTWNIYNSTGVLINSFVRNYHRFSLDNNLTGIWFWEGVQTNFSHAMIATLDVNDLTFSASPVLLTSGGPASAFAFSDSCPILVYPLGGEPVVPNISGIYYVNPSGTHDSYYNDVEKKIPNPTVKTALLGE
jgi:hypothetical protein